MIVFLGKSTRPLPCGVDQSAFNTASCDPDAFAALLCLHLGVPLSEADGVVEMNAVLAEKARESDFFFRSYAVDPIGVSRRLLALIDEISLGASADFSWASLSEAPRLTQIARIASEFEERATAMTLAQKLRRIIRLLEDETTSTPLTRLVLSEPRPTWPRIGRELFNALEAKGVAIVEREKIAPTVSKTDLNRVANKILSRDATDRIPFADDKSIIRINGASVAEVADAVSAFVQSELQSAMMLTIVRSDEAEALDAALARQNLAVLGCGRLDRGSSPAEILPLMLDLISGPPDPASFLAFLNVEPNPLPPALRSWLIRELKEKSAVDPENSCAIVDQFVSKIEDDKVTERAASWKEWLRIDYHKVSDGITASGIEPILQRIESWAESTIGVPGLDESVTRGFSTLIANVRGLRKAMTAVGQRSLTRIQLQSLIAQTLSPARHVTHREQSSVLVVDDASAIPIATDTVIWWMAHDRTLPRARAAIWIAPERTALERCGIELPSTDIAVEESYAAAARLLSVAKQRLVFVTVDRIGDDPMAVHPLWYEIEESFTEECRPMSISVQGVWNLLAAAGRNDMAITDVTPHTPFHPTWEIPDAPTERRERESPSSLEKMLGCPLAWTLQYRAGLYDNSSYSLADGFLLLGILAHACFEEFFRSGSWTLPQDRATTAATQIFERCLATRAGILLAPGRDRERLEAQSKTVAGMLDLAAMMTAGGWEFVAAEETIETVDLAQPVRGRLDLHFRRSNKPSEKLIIDVKYVGKRRRVQELMRGAAIQLATYSRILRAGESWPKTAYYIVMTKDLLTVHGDVAPNLYRVNGEDERDVWGRIESAITATTERLGRGLIDVGIDDENPSILAESGRVAPAPCNYCDYRLFCRTDRRNS